MARLRGSYWATAFLTFLGHVSVAASAINVQAQVHEFSTLEVVTLSNSGLDLSRTYTSRRVGEVIIKNNLSNGFKIRVTTDNDFKMIYKASEVPYSLKLARKNGSISKGLKRTGALTMTENSEITFSGIAKGVTEITYRVVYASTPGGLLTPTKRGEFYSDKVYFSVEEL